MAQEQQAMTDQTVKTSATSRGDTAGYRGGLARTLVRTLLIFTFIPLALMGAAAYWRARTLLQDQVVQQMRAQIVDQVGDVNLAIKTKRIRLDRLVRNTSFQSVAQSAVRAGGAGIDSLRTDMNALVRGVSQEGGPATFNQYFLMDPAGKIVLSSNPAWDGAQLRDQAAFATLAQSDHTSYTFYSFPPLYEKELVLLTISQVRGPGAVPLGTMVGITESGELESILRNLASVGAGAEALFVTEDGKLIGTDPYTNEITLVEPPAEQAAPIVTQLDRMMGESNAPPASVTFRDEDGTRYFGQVLWLESLHAGILYQIGERLVFGALTSLLPFTILVILVSLAAMGVVLTLGTRRVFRPLADLADITGRFAAGDFTQRAVARTKDEIGLLAQAFNGMAEDLSGLYRSLEERVEERTRQMRTAADVAERITSTTSLGDLLNRTAQLLIEQFSFYQASIFLLDRTHRYAVLRASFGPAANDMLSKAHRLEVGSASIIGWVTANNQPRIAADVTEDPVHMRNPLLPDTRSEAGVPIRTGNTVLGALDVQSTEPRAFGPDTIVMLQTLANQIAAAVQNMTLAEASQTNMQELERLYDGSRKIFSSQTREQVLARSAEQVAEASFPALLLTVHGQQLELQGRPDVQRPDIAGIVQALPVLESHLAEVRRYVSGGPVIAEQSSLGLPLPLLDFTRQVGHRSVAFLPINHREELAGLLIVSSPSRPLSSALVEPYAGLADLVGVCLDRLAETEETERRLVEREALSKISHAVAESTGDLSAFFVELHTQVRANIGDYAFAVALFDATQDAISLPYSYQEGRVEKIETLPLGEGLTSILIRTGQPLLLADDVERRAQRLGARTVGRPARSWMGAPMMVDNKPIGALIIQDLQRENSFTERNLSFLGELAAQVATVVNTARLLDQSRRHAYQLETAAEIARDMSGSLNLDELLLKAVNYLRDRLGYYHASVFLLDPKREFAVVRESTGEAGAQLKRVGHKLAVNSRSIVGFVAGRGEPLIVGDTSKDPTYFANPLLPETRSEAAVPLRVSERVVGVMDVQSSNLHAFEEEDVRTLQILADQLAVAVVNSELFAETQEHLSQQRLLQHITTAAASGTTLEEALDGAVTGLQVTLGGDRVSILLLNRESQRLEIRAAVGYSDAIFGLQIPVGSGITGWSAAHARALRVDDVAEDSRYVEGSPNTRAELAVPLLYRNEVLGVLNVESEQPAAYSDSDEEMLTTLAGSLAAVIANARLLEQVRAQAERERALFEITGKIRRAPDIQAILATTASELTRVVGAQRAQIRVSNEGTNGEAAKEE
jgi:GAF domain-containing protein/HAMP domain-containing protein